MIKTKNNRQIPKMSEIMSNKNYCDMLYCYLQVNSQFDSFTKTRYIPKKEVKFSTIGPALGMTRQTASTKFKKLEEMGLIIFNQEKNRYELVVLDKEIANLIPVETLRKLISVMNENTINVYMVLVNNWYINNKMGYIIYFNTIKSCIGLSTTTRSNNYIISDIFEILQKLSLISYEIQSIIDNGKIRTIYFIKNVSTTL